MVSLTKVCYSEDTMLRREITTSIADSFKVFGAKQALKYVDRDFEHNAVKMCDWLIEHDKGGGVKNEATMVRNVLVDPNNRRLMMASGAS